MGVAAEAVAGEVQVRLGGHHQHVRLARPDGDGDLSLVEAGSSESAGGGATGLSSSGWSSSFLSWGWLVRTDAKEDHPKPLYGELVTD